MIDHIRIKTSEEVTLEEATEAIIEEGDLIIAKVNQDIL